jgi:hypothetical protein
MFAQPVSQKERAKAGAPYFRDAPKCSRSEMPKKTYSPQHLPPYRLSSSYLATHDNQISNRRVGSETITGNGPRYKAYTRPPITYSVITVRAREPLRYTGFIRQRISTPGNAAQRATVSCSHCSSMIVNGDFRYLIKEHLQAFMLSHGLVSRETLLSPQSCRRQP